MKQYLLNLHTSEGYNRFRNAMSKQMMKWGLLTDERKNAIIRFNNSLKSLLMQQQNIFEGMNIRYFGPIDGHDTLSLIKVMNEIKDMNGPKILHIHTTKGKGYKPAEECATEWHAPGRFDKETGIRIKPAAEGMPPLFQEVFGNTLLELAQANSRIVGVTPAMPSGCSMNIMMREMPERVFDVGIAEGHAVTFSAGMAKDGLMPFCNIYSTFMQRAYDNVIHDVAIQKLNVVMCLDRAGLVGEDGATHHGMFDIAYMRIIPNLTVAVPMDEHELRKMMYTAQLPDMGPFVIRYPRGRGMITDWKCKLEAIPVGKGRLLKEGKDLAVISLGPIGYRTAKAIERVEQESGISVAHYDLRFVKPLDTEMLEYIGKNFKKVITIEDGILAGGAGSAVMEFMSDPGYDTKIIRMGLEDHFVQHGSVNELYKICGLDEDSIYEKIKNS